MAKARILAPWVGEEERAAVYHCVSRVVERRFHFGKVEKEKFVKLMRIYEAFCGVKVLSYCVMSNHFHILVEVPPRPEGGISDEEILERLSLVQQPENIAVLRELFESYQGKKLTEKGREAHEALREQYMSRMWDLGKFMKFLKQNFSRWFNATHKRKGTLWEERYSSSLVESGYAALVTSAYIDLNPVRAGMVGDPKDYRWSSYAEAVAGGKLAREGIASVVFAKDSAEAAGKVRSEENLQGYAWRSIAGRYRVFLFEEGRAPGQSQQAREVQGEKRTRRKGFSQKQIEQEIERGGELGIAAKLHCQTRSLIDGAVIGSRAFVQKVIVQLNEKSYWTNPRKSEGSRLKITPRIKSTRKSKGDDGKNAQSDIPPVNLEGEELWSLRHLQKE